MFLKVVANSRRVMFSDVSFRDKWQAYNRFASLYLAFFLACHCILRLTLQFSVEIVCPPFHCLQLSIVFLCQGWLTRLSIDSCLISNRVQAVFKSQGVRSQTEKTALWAAGDSKWLVIIFPSLAILQQKKKKRSDPRLQAAVSRSEKQAWRWCQAQESTVAGESASESFPLSLVEITLLPNPICKIEFVC